MRHKKVIEETSDHNTLQWYFDEVGDVYRRNGGNMDIEYCPENRDKLIEMNLKCVVKIAKAYRGMGLSLEELISAGNEGLCIAFDKYKPSKNNTREVLLEKIDSLNEDVVSIEWVEDNIGSVCKYGKLKKKYDKFIENKKEFKKKSVRSWVNRSVTKATFNSVAMLWVNAAIRQELDARSRLVKKPKRDIEGEKTGESKRDIYIDIDAPVSEKGTNTVADILDVQDSSISSIEIDEVHSELYDLLSDLFEGVRARDRRMLLQRFGVGYTRALLPKEISEREQVSVARVSQIISNTISTMKKNAVNKGIDISDILQDLDRTNNVI